jgi:hypothetical protein
MLSGCDVEPRYLRMPLLLGLPEVVIGLYGYAIKFALCELIARRSALAFALELTRAGRSSWKNILTGYRGICLLAAGAHRRKT